MKGVDEEEPVSAPVARTEGEEGLSDASDEKARPGDEGEEDLMEVEEIPADLARQSSVFFVRLSFRSGLYLVPVAPTEKVDSIFDFVSEVLAFRKEHCKIIWKGKTLQPASKVGEVVPALSEGSKLMLVGSSEEAVNRIRAARCDPLVKGFAAVEEDDRKRRNSDV